MTLKKNRNKKIIILSPAIGSAGGADKAAKLLAEAYAELGYTVRVFATSCETKTDNANITISGPLFNKGHRWKIPQRSLIARLFLFSLFQKPVFIHTVGLTLEVRLTLKYLSNFKIVVWETTEANKSNKFVDKKIIPLLPNANLILAPSQIIKRNIQKNYQYKGKIEILPFWVNWDIKPNTVKYKRNNKILYIGRLDLDKGFDCLFNALRIIKPEIEVNICGKGNKAQLKEMSKDLPEVRIHGFVSNETANKLYEEADFVILPSKHEGYPLSLIEALGRGKPIIATKVGSIPEVFGSSKAAVLFSKNNSVELAQKVEYLYSEDEKEYKKRINEALSLFAVLNSRVKIQQKILNIIRML